MKADCIAFYIPSEANYNKILFNASKSQLLYFSNNDDPMHVIYYIIYIMLRMSHGEMVPYVQQRSEGGGGGQGGAKS